MGLDCLIYFALTAVIPFKLTYSALKEDQKENKIALYSHYWAFYVILGLLQCLLSFFSYQPLKLILLIFHLWLYSEDYQGALFLGQLIRQKATQFGLDQYVKQVAQVLSIAKVFDLGEEAEKKE